MFVCLLCVLYTSFNVVTWSGDELTAVARRPPYSAGVPVTHQGDVGQEEEVSERRRLLRRQQQEDVRAAQVLRSLCLTLTCTIQ